MNADLSVYLVTDSRSVADVPAVVAQAVSGGVTAVQVREKQAPARAFLELVAAVAEVLPRSVPLIVNDRVDIYLAARSVGVAVAGVHLGQDDLPVSFVRSVVGPDALIGLSVSSEADLEQSAVDLRFVDYLGVGPVFHSATKSDGGSPIGLGGLRDLVARTNLPVVAIGGLSTANFAMLRALGAVGGAVVSAIFSAPDPAATARALVREWSAGRGSSSEERKSLR